MSFTRVSLRGVLRDITKVLVGTVLGILLARSFLHIDGRAGSCSPLKLNKRILQSTLDVMEEARKGHDCICNDTNGEVVVRSNRIQKPRSTPSSRAKYASAQVPVEVGERPKTLQGELGAAIRKPLFIGVVTAQNLLPTRARAVNATWGKKASKLAFFSSVGRSMHGLPVVSLPGVDDTYPPQKKVFRMLKYMHDYFINDYNWFMRADDDVYVRVEKLVDFLSRLDHTKELYLGQPGMGKPDDLERIKLRSHEHYCMGGPGVIYSRALLVKLAPHLEDCLKNEVVSFNEDLEVGRCISRRVGVQCTWNYQMAKLFYQDYSHGDVFKSPAVYNDDNLANALTVHSFKDPAMMHRVHQFFLELAVRSSELETQKYSNELERETKVTGRPVAFP